MKILSLIIIILTFLPQNILSSNLSNTKNKIYDYVDPFIGTDGHGHTYPGATLPFGMVQLSPDTRQDNSWDGCSGYHYSDNSIIGFSHTHLSGTGVSDYGDILFMPIIDDIKLNPGFRNNPDAGYRSRFSHENESAAPGYYSVVLDDYNIKAELTVSDRAGFHKYTFPQSKDAHILIDLKHRDPVMESEFTIINNTEISGYRRSKFWAGDQRVYFYAKFSKPFDSCNIYSEANKISDVKSFNGKNIIGILNFQTTQGEIIFIKVGISAVSIAGAKKNLEQEIPHWDFDHIRRDAQDIWNKALTKITVTGGALQQKRIFYSALYHCLLTPNLYQDVDGMYRGMDGKIHKAEGFVNYTVFSLWDTFRALHPLLTIIEPNRTRDFIITLLKKYEQSGEFPMWELAANDTRCMIGYHAVSIIADAYFKGITNFDTKKILQAMVVSADVNKRGINYYKELGYVPTNKSSQSVSKTLEYAYDDWCIAQFAKAINNKTVYERFSQRARFFENVFDNSINFMRPQYSTREWMKNFDPRAVNYNYNFTEGNSYQYSLFVPHDIASIIKNVGGDSQFINWLDDLFNTQTTDDLGEESDVSGLIGQYAHGNEPSHHMAYLYNYAGVPWKTQAIVRKIMNDFYTDNPAGLCGNEDCGQLSAWYVLNALGFYPVCPGMPEYVIGSPTFDKIEIKQDNSRIFTIKTNNNSNKNKYIQNVQLNNNDYEFSYLSHYDIVQGGSLTFEMGENPNKNWGKDLKYRPTSDTEKIVMLPYQLSDSKDFIDNKKIILACDSKNAEIYYSVDGTIPDTNSIRYVDPIEINKTTLIKARAFKPNYSPSYITILHFKKAESISNISETDIQAGLEYAYYEGIYRSVYDFTHDMPVKSGVVKKFDISHRNRDEWIGFTFKGYMKISKDGNYNFAVAANDGCQMLIDGKELFESDGRKSNKFTLKSEITLAQGFHEIELKFFQCSDRIHLKTYWQGSGFERQEIPENVLFHSVDAKKN